MRRLPAILFLAFLAAALSALVSPASAESLTVDSARSVFAVLTHKGGLASGLAHDHLVTAPKARVTVTFDAAAPEATRLEITTRADDLEIDHFAPRAQWKARLHELGAGPKELDPITEADRAKVRAAMLGEDQLDPARFPEIRAELVSLARAPKKSGPFDWTAKIRLTLHGKSVERDLAARFAVEGDTVTAEALGEFRFTEFGIKPYSAALGAVKNQDPFHVYVNLTAAIP